MRWIVIGSLAIAAPASADHASVHLTANGDVATTDNVFATPTDRAFDLFFQLRPGVLFAYDAPRMIHELDAQAELLEYVAHNDAPSVTYHAGWKGYFLPGPLSEVLLSANASNGKLNALTTRTSPDQSGVAVMPVGAIDVDQLDASEMLSVTAGKSTRVSEDAFARWIATDDNAMMPTKTSTAEVGANLGIDRTFQNNSLGIQLGASYLRLQLTAPIGAVIPSHLDNQVNPRGVAVWRHDIDKKWSTSVDAGAVYVNPIGTSIDAKTALFPVFGGLVAYTEAWGRATLNVRRSVTPNLFIASNTVDDSAVAQMAMPLPWLDQNRTLRVPKLVGLGSIGVDRTQLIDATTSTLAGEFFVTHVDLGVAWTPNPGQTYSVRYEFIYQSGNSVATMLIPAYYRNTLFFTFAVRYPDRVAAQVPRSLQSVRADRKDLAPVGAEPVVPDPSEALPDEGDTQ